MSDGQRRVVSVLIADVVGSTSIAEKLGPERSKFLFDEVARLMRAEVERFGGTVAQLTGDGILALFGAPTALENDSERAVRAAVALQRAIDRYGAEVGPGYGIELAARAAVNTGPVVVPERDASPDVLFNALGDTVNVAARLQAFGALVVGPQTARQVEDTFELEALGALYLKGKSERVPAFRVVGIRAARATRGHSPLVGREHEVATLSGALDGILEGRGAIVAMTGEPGIGKSRLIAEMQELYADRVQFLIGHAVSDTENIPYWPVRELLRTWLGVGSSDSEARVRLELRAHLARVLAQDADESYPFLAALLGLALEPAQEQRMRDYAPDAVQRQTFDWVYELFSALAREQPLCLALEDLQWSDEATLSLLDELLPAAERGPICFLLIHRSDSENPAWQLVDRARRRLRRVFAELELKPLADDDARALAEVDAGGELPPELAQLFVDRAGGNPYFVGEAIRELLERGALERQNGRLVLVGDAAIPGKVQEALQARLDRLDPDARQLIATAAVVGRTFALPMLERLLPRMRLLPTLSELEWLGLIVEERSLPQPEYRFRHGLVQEVAYGALVETQRRELHMRVGEALEDIHRETVEEVWGLLARHFAEAGDAERAADYHQKAGDSARSSYANEDAIVHYQRALTFLDQLGDTERARETLLKIALTHHLAFDFPAANAAFGEAFERPQPVPARLEPSERLAWALTAAWDRAVAPGHSWSSPAWDVGSNVFRGLVRVGRDLGISPDVAERFTVSDDGRTYRFKIRHDARWSDGVPLTAHDFVFTYMKMVEDDVATAYWLDGAVAQAIDDRTLELRLAEARNTFLYMLARPPFFPWPRHAYERSGPDWHRALPLVGNGPFVVTSRNEERVVIESAQTWHGARGNVGAVTIELQDSPSGAARRWQRGEFDVIDESLAINITADDQSVVQRLPGMMTWYLGFDARSAPLDDPRVRRAFAHGIDRRGPAAALGGTAASSGGLIPPTMPGHSHRVAPVFDPERSRALLEEVGFSSGRAPAEIVLASLELWEAAAVDVASQLALVGLPIRLLLLPSDAELDATLEGNAHFWAWGADIPDPGGGVLAPILGNGPMLYRDQQLEQLLAQAASLREQDERLRLYREYERIWIGEQAAVVPIAYSDSILWTRPWVTGMWRNAIHMSTFADVVVQRAKH